jgi:hypothetical protein
MRGLACTKGSLIQCQPEYHSWINYSGFTHSMLTRALCCVAALCPSFTSWHKRFHFPYRNLSSPAAVLLSSEQARLDLRRHASCAE